MYYPDELIEDVRTTNDIVDVVSSYVKLTRKGSSYFGLCPFHHEKSPSFSVSPGKQMFYCFGCGEGGNVISFIMKYENFSFLESVKYLADRAGINLPEAEYSEEERKKADLKSVLLDINKDAALYFYKMLKSEKGERAMSYLKGRGLSDETIVKFGLGYSTNYSDDLYRYMKNKGHRDEILKQTGLFIYSEKGVYDRFINRVMFPIMDVNGKVIGFGGRVMGQGEPKYLNSPETPVFDKGKNLYGLNVARTSRKDSIIIGEGYMDVISLHQAGFNNAVASLGTALTQRQALLIKRYSKNVYLTYDSDGAGVKAALRAIPIFKDAGAKIKVVDMKPYKDPDEFIKNLGADQYQKRIDSARESFMYEIDRMKDNINRDSPEQKAEFYTKVARKILDFDDELVRMTYIEAVSNEFFIPKDALNQSVKKQALTYTKEEGSNFSHTEDVVEKRQKTKEVPKDDGIKKSQRILLTWLVEEPHIYGKVKNYLTPDDFLDELYHKVAAMIYEQLEAGVINPAKVLNFFEDEDEHRIAASLFNTSIDSILEEEKEKAFRDTIYKIKLYSLEEKAKHITDIKELQENINEKKKIDSTFKNISYTS